MHKGCDPVAIMGGDGGQVIDRATMVKTKGWGLTKGSGNRYAASLGEMANYMQMVTEDIGLGRLEKHRTTMSQCWLSQEELGMHVVACKLGNLYNKEAMIGAFLNKSMPATLSHIKKLSDLKNCVITWKTHGLGDQSSIDGQYAVNDDAKKHMVCPISRDDLDSGSSRAVVIWKTGVVVGIKGLKALKANECPVTGQPFDFDTDVIQLAPDNEELKKLVERLPVAKKRKAPAESSASSKGETPLETTAIEKAGDKAAATPARDVDLGRTDGSGHMWTSEYGSYANPKKVKVKNTDANAAKVAESRGPQEIAGQVADKALVIGDTVKSLVAQPDCQPRALNVGDAGTVLDIEDCGMIRVEFEGEPPMIGSFLPRQLRRMQGKSIYKSLFTNNSERLEGLGGQRDAFGTPCYNRGSRIC